MLWEDHLSLYFRQFKHFQAEWGCVILQEETANGERLLRVSEKDQLLYPDLCFQLENTTSKTINRKEILPLVLDKYGISHI